VRLAIHAILVAYQNQLDVGRLPSDNPRPGFGIVSLALPTAKIEVALEVRGGAFVVA
jgi:hypothetical protein